MHQTMERGRTFYISLASGILALALLLTSVNLPAQLVIETKPYALVVLKSGKLDGWTAEQLGITPVQLEMVKNNYDKFLSGHRTPDDSNSESSDSLEDSDNEVTEEHKTEYKNGVKKDRLVSESSSDESSSSSSDENEAEDSSDSVELTLEQKLKDKPVTQTVGLGLFHATLCNVLKTSERRCYTVSDNEAIFVMKEEVPYVENDITMPMWNNLRVESLFSVITCSFGLICLLASLKPCCDNRRLPVYLGSVSFFTSGQRACSSDAKLHYSFDYAQQVFYPHYAQQVGPLYFKTPRKCQCFGVCCEASGVLVFIPIVRLLLISSDFEQSLATTMNVATRLLMPWSLVVSGIGAPLAFIASFTLIATKWYRITKKWYHVIKSQPDDLENIPNGDAVEIKMTTIEQNNRKPVYTMNKDENNQNTEEKNPSAGEGCCR